MKKDRNVSKKLILDVLNDKEDTYSLNEKLFYIVNVNMIVNDKNKFFYDGKVEYGNNIFKDIVVDYFNNNNFIYQDNVKGIVSSIINNDKIEDFAKKIVNDTDVDTFLKCGGAFGKVIQDYINNNIKICIEMFQTETQGTQYDIDEINKGYDKLVEDIENKINNPSDYEKLSEFASKLGKDELNELQNILIQCEYDEKVLQDFTQAVDNVVINKNTAEDQLYLETILIYNTKNNTLSNMSIIDKQENARLSFEKLIDYLNEHKNENLIMIQAKKPSFKMFNDKENIIINNLFELCKYNNSKILDFLAVNADVIKKNGLGELNYRSLIDNKCYSYKYKTTDNFKNHISKLEINDKLKNNQNLYSNTENQENIEVDKMRK